MLPTKRMFLAWIPHCLRIRERSYRCCFDPKCPKLESLVDKVKEAMETTEVRRTLPKVPKV